MVKTLAWDYLDKVVERRKTVTFGITSEGGYVVCLNGFFFGLGDTCKSALNSAIRDTKRRRERSGY
jgi:hypothetical protein